MSLSPQLVADVAEAIEDAASYWYTSEYGEGGAYECRVIDNWDELAQVAVGVVLDSLNEP